MKKVLYAVCITAAAFAVSCGKNNPTDDKEPKTEENTLTGTWMMRSDEYHYFDATFKADETYEWTWKGAGDPRTDKGTYKVSGKNITLTPTKFLETDYEKDDGSMKEISAEEFGWSGPRTVIVEQQLGGVAFWRWKNDNFISDSDDFFEEPVIVFKEGADLGIKAADVKGTWEYRNEEGVIERFIFEDRAFTEYSAWPSELAEGGYEVRKDTGTWSLEGNVLTLNYQKTYTSYKRVQNQEYIYYKVDPTTLEAEKWETYDDSYTFTYYIYIAEGKLYLPVATFTKK